MITGTLRQLLSTQNYHIGLEFLEAAYRLHGKLLSQGILDIAGLYYAFFIYEKNGLTEQATEMLDVLNVQYNRSVGNTSIIARVVHDANYVRFINLTDEGDYAAAIKYLDYLDLENRDIFHTLLQLLIKAQIGQETTKHDDTLENISPQGQKEEKVEGADKAADAAAAALHKLPSSVINFITMVDTGQLDKTLLPVQLVECYFRYKKYEQKLASSDVVLSGRVEWTIGPDKYFYSPNAGSGIYKLKSISHYYSGIENNLLTQLEPNLKEQFCAALEHVRIARPHDQSGLKIYDNIVELKIMGDHGDHRLFTDTLYKVGNNLLALFNRVGKHIDVERLHKANGELRIIDASHKTEKHPEEDKAARSYIPDPQGYYSKFIRDLDYAALDPAIFLAGEGWANVEDAASI